MARRKRRPVPKQFARHPDTRRRVIVAEYDQCGKPVSYPNVLGAHVPCQEA